MLDRKHAQSFFKRGILGAHILIAFVIFLTLADPRDAWIIFGGGGLTMAGGLYSGFKYMYKYSEPTQLNITEIFKNSLFAFLVVPITVFFVLTEDDISNSTDLILYVAVIFTIIIETMIISTIMSYTILYNNGVHNFEKGNPEFTKDPKGLYKLLGIILIFPFFVFLFLNTIIFGIEWYTSSFSIVVAIQSFVIIGVFGYICYIVFVKFNQINEDKKIGHKNG